MARGGGGGGRSGARSAGSRMARNAGRRVVRNATRPARGYKSYANMAYQDTPWGKATIGANQAIDGAFLGRAKGVQGLANKYMKPPARRYINSVTPNRWNRGHLRSDINNNLPDDLFEDEATEDLIDDMIHQLVEKIMNKAEAHIRAVYNDEE